MTRRVYKEALAELDLIEHIDYLQDQASTEVALRFIDAAEQALERLSEQPAIGAQREFANPRLAGIRMWPVPEFSRYLIFYQHNDDEIRVLRVLHSSRDITSLFSSED